MFCFRCTRMSSQPLRYAPTTLLVLQRKVPFPPTLTGTAFRSLVDKQGLLPTGIPSPESYKLQKHRESQEPFPADGRHPPIKLPDDPASVFFTVPLPFPASFSSPSPVSVLSARRVFYPPYCPLPEVPSLLSSLVKSYAFPSAGPF